MNKQPPPVKITKLRKLLDEAEIPWREVRDEPNCTYLPESYHGIWWQPDALTFRWGHNFEHEDETPEQVIARLEVEGR